MCTYVYHFVYWLDKCIPNSLLQQLNVFCFPPFFSFSTLCTLLAWARLPAYNSSKSSPILQLRFSLYTYFSMSSAFRHPTRSFPPSHSSSIHDNTASTSTQQRRPSVSSACSDLSETSRNIVINDQWLVLGKIGQGSFGEVFEGIHVYPW